MTPTPVSQEARDFVAEQGRAMRGITPREADAIKLGEWDDLPRLQHAARFESTIRKQERDQCAKVEWQDIATAPKDGTWFLACATAPGWGATRIVRFKYPDDRLPIHGEGQMWPSAPTHWMPLPEAPAIRKGSEA